MRVNAILKRPSRQLSTLLQRVDDLERLNAIALKHLKDNFVKHCRVANYRKKELVLVVDSTAWATRLRYTIPDLLESLQKEVCFADLRRISYSVDPRMSHLWRSEKEPLAKSVVLSQSTRSLLRQVAQSIQSPKLQKALLHLARD